MFNFLVWGVFEKFVLVFLVGMLMFIKLVIFIGYLVEVMVCIFVDFGLFFEGFF